MTDCFQLPNCAVKIPFVTYNAKELHPRSEVPSLFEISLISQVLLWVDDNKNFQGYAIPTDPGEQCSVQTTGSIEANHPLIQAVLPRA